MCLKQHQPPLNLDEQIENLKSLGLIIENEDKAREFLNDVSYFRLIKAYSLGLKEKNSKYSKDITFDRIVELYLFNSRFRQIIFTQIEKVEISLRCRISNYFSEKYGMFGYEDVSNFKNKQYHSNLMDEINSVIIINSRNDFVRNYQQNYVSGKIPLYALVELLSFGTLSKFYKNMNNADKKEIAKSYSVGYKYLESWIEHLSFVRNVCAHYGRLYNINLRKTPLLSKKYSNKNISNIRVFATLLCLKELLYTSTGWRQFVDETELLLSKYTNVKKELMGFPDNWKELLL